MASSSSNSLASPKLNSNTQSNVNILGRHLGWFSGGFLISFGMLIGGMAHHSSLSFFDPLHFAGITPNYAPSLLVVFMAALIPNFIYHRYMKTTVPAMLANHNYKPLFADKCALPLNTIIDRKLIIGGVIFALGWAISGFCPGPSVALMLSGNVCGCLTSFGMLSYYVSVGLLPDTYDPASPLTLFSSSSSASLLSFVKQIPLSNLLLTASLSLVPAICYYSSPLTYFAVIPSYNNNDNDNNNDNNDNNAPSSLSVPPQTPLVEWPLELSLLGGLAIALATITVAHTVGGVLGIAGIWRGILNSKLSVVSRSTHLMMFSGFVTGALFAAFVCPRAFERAPYQATSTSTATASIHLDAPALYSTTLYYTYVLGGFLVAYGTHLANGCTSGHGVVGIGRMSLRSLVVVSTFMGCLFVFVPLQRFLH